MIQLVTASGQVMRLPDDVSFVELCDEEGSPALVFLHAPNSGSISAISAKSPQAARYLNLMRKTRPGLDFCPIVDVTVQEHAQKLEPA